MGAEPPSSDSRRRWPRLKGTAGSFGYRGITTLAAEVDDALAAGLPTTAVERCAQLLQHTRAEIGLPR